MELLDQLEQRVTSLVTQLESLRDENRTLREEIDNGLAALADENRTLKEALEQERNVKDTVLGRIDTLLTQLKDKAGDA